MMLFSDIKSSGGGTAIAEGKSIYTQDHMSHITFITPDGESGFRFLKSCLDSTRWCAAK